MRKTLMLLPGLLAGALYLHAQAPKSKSIIADTLKTVEVKSYLFNQSLLNVPAAISTLGPAQLKLQPDNSLVPAMNTIPGVRMEERSPGSYRLSLRGSLLRSPFGVRDVKVYYDEIPLTDAGGNTYLNAIDPTGIRSIEVLKGPDGSLFGANSGGVVIIRPTGNIDTVGQSASIGINGGSYGLFHENAALHSKLDKDQLDISQAHETYDGYRQHSNMRRNYFQVANRWSYSAGNELKAMAFYSDLFYNTPGGLTFTQQLADPRSARLGTAAVPGAIDQNISITTQMLTGGLVNSLNLSRRLKNVTAVYGSHVYFANPFITNYEQRDENTFGLRSYFEWRSRGGMDLQWKINAGLEWQQTNSAINNYGNKKGVKDTAQTLDRINTNQHFFFVRYLGDLSRFHFEAALSLNNYSYQFKNLYPLAQTGFTPRNFSAQLMPRLALSYQLTNNFIARASVSRGYSTPTTAEVRPTDNVINTALQAQTGWNYETGLRLRNLDETLILDASVFYYRTDNAIVRRLHPDETEYYINAGGTNQTGVELAFSDWLIRLKRTGFIRGLQFNTSYTLSRYFFRDYVVAGANYSGNPLTGVPRNVVVSSLQTRLAQGFSLFVQHSYTAEIPLNDASTVYAPHYNLIQAKLAWSHRMSKKTRLEIYAGADNILNQHYSLGNDLNAVGNRYFNPSALRNYFAGINLNL
ncbi:iron complex outermembrane receptor protein [Mucilaginibacter yixingensis]|uniref:Iron complex outermembrane receptor protein n=1 Tax=Mucilaginibacter yixingensis TaxID=1295612 RepID=A0A2T5JF35_9SPHI|nr:TonB-dependent receptor [Mucilaginibacter yixingensis]PTR01050.1 iron complex outermembrane receptor protein [Mucilaginibacter yixingensis]